MTRRAANNSTPPSPPAKLIVVREEAAQLIAQQINDGEAIEAQMDTPTAAQVPVNEQIEEWKKYTTEVLRRIFDTEEYSKKFDSAAMHIYMENFQAFSIAGPRTPHRSQPEPNPRRIVKEYLNNLRLLHKSLPLIPEPRRLMQMQGGRANSMQSSHSDAQDPIEQNARRLLAIMVEQNEQTYSNVELQELSGIANHHDVNDALEWLNEEGAAEVDWIDSVDDPHAGAEVTLKAKGKSLHRGFAPKPQPPAGVTHNYNLNAANSRVNISSTDNSYNVVNTTHETVFAELKAILMKVENTAEREQLVAAVDDMQAAQKSGGFIEKYQAFIQQGANHMTLIAPLIPALTKLMGY